MLCRIACHFPQIGEYASGQEVGADKVRRTVMEMCIRDRCQNTSVIACLIQHIDEIRVFEDVGNLRGTKQVVG